MGKQFTVADGYMFTMLSWAERMKWTTGQEDAPGIGPDGVVLSDLRGASYIRPAAPDRA